MGKRINLDNNITFILTLALIVTLPLVIALYFKNSTGVAGVKSYIATFNEKNNLPPKNETLSTLSKIKEIKYLTESGISASDFSKKHQEIYIEYRKYCDKYPENPLLPQFAKSIEAIKDLDDQWRKSFKGEDSHYGFFQLDLAIINKYPELSNLEIGKYGAYRDDFVPKMMNAVSRTITETEAIVNQKYK